MHEKISNETFLNKTNVLISVIYSSFWEKWQFFLPFSTLALIFALILPDKIQRSIVMCFYIFVNQRK